MTSENTHVAFPIVGLGASAGGLEAMENFFRHVPTHSGMASRLRTIPRPPNSVIHHRLRGQAWYASALVRSVNRAT